jgi:hypothetical protein
MEDDFGRFDDPEQQKFWEQLGDVSTAELKLRLHRGSYQMPKKGIVEIELERRNETGEITRLNDIVEDLSAELRAKSISLKLAWVAAIAAALSSIAAITNLLLHEW